MGLPILTLNSPANLAASSKLSNWFSILYKDTTDSLAADTIIIDIDIVNTFDSENKLSYIYNSVAHNTSITRMVELTSNTWYWRVTATNASGTTISDIYSINVSYAKMGALSQYENIGINFPTRSLQNALSQYENIGINGPYRSLQNAFSQYENITVKIKKRKSVQII